MLFDLKKLLFNKKKGDSRVQKLLDTLALTYYLDSHGNFQVAARFNNGRSQIAFIESDTQSIDDFETREIWSIAYVSKGFLDIDTANTLLLENQKLPLGFWHLKEKENNTFLVTFCVKVAVDCTPEDFQKVLIFVLQVADDMENKLTGRDRL